MAVQCRHTGSAAAHDAPTGPRCACHPRATGDDWDSDGGGPRPSASRHECSNLADVKATAYVRQSQDRNGEGLGIARQTEDCHTLIDQRGWKLARTLVDNDRSAAGRMVRPGFETLLQEIEAGRTQAVVAW